LSKWLSDQSLTSHDYDRVIDMLYKYMDFASRSDAIDALDCKLDFKGDLIREPFQEFYKNLGLRGWLADYMEHTRKTESPRVFHFVTGGTLVGATLRRNVYVDQSIYKIWPCVQSLLVGPTSVKKTTAANYGMNTVGEQIDSIGGTRPYFNRLGNRGSGEGLISRLATLSRKEGEATGLIVVGELTTFMGKQEYNETLIQTLTDLFDCPSIIKETTNMRGEVSIKNVALSFIGASNEEWLSTAMPSSAFAGGFTGRVIMVQQEYTEHYYPRPPKPPAESLHRLQAGLYQMSVIPHQAVSLTREGEKFFDDKYYWLKYNPPSDARMESFHDRLGDHMLRWAMLFAVSESPGEKQVLVEKHHLEWAWEFLRWVEGGLSRIYDDAAATPFVKLQKKILRTLKVAGGQMPRDQLHAQFWGTMKGRREYQDAIEELKQMGKIQPIQVADDDGGLMWKIRE
jgi:hypothetical protein